MSVSYKPLWKLLIDREMNKTELRKAAGISTSALAKLGKNAIDELAVAMECRCYHGGEGRTRLKELHYTGKDICVLIFSVVMCAGIWTLRYYGL